MASTVVIYHAKCSDGFCAAWLLSKLHTDAIFIPAQHGSKLPPIGPEADVFILDFSYPQEVMVELQTRCKSLLVLDHHITAQKDCEGLSFCKFDMTKSGAMLALDYCSSIDYYFHLPGMLTLVKYVQDRDLWDFVMPFSREINAVIRSYPMTFSTWDELSHKIAYDFDSLIIEGTAIVRYRKGIINSHIEQAITVVIAGHKVLGCYCSVGEIISEVAGELAKNKLFGCCWFDLPSNKRVYSLRSDDYGLDVSIIAKSLGGGGHKHASSFATSIPLR